jgi:hypothetical protein
MIRAFSASMLPSAIAARVAVNSTSSTRARWTSPNAAGRVALVWCASQAAVEVAPVSSPARFRSASASTRSRSSASLAACRVSLTSASRCSAAVSAHAGASATASRPRSIESSNRSTAGRPAGAPGGGDGGWLVDVMPPR